MRIENIINKILSLPREFNKLENTSINFLLKQSGYFEIYNQINEINIITQLNKYPEYIKDWQNWSENKRSTGWYFKQSILGGYIVGYLSIRENRVIEYSDIAAACAYFIKQEIEDIRKSL